MFDLKFKYLFYGCLFFVIGLSVTAFFGFFLYFVPLSLFFLAFLFFVIFKKKFKIRKFSFSGWSAFLFLFLGAFWFAFNVVFCYNRASDLNGCKKTVLASLRRVEVFDDGGSQYIFKVKEVEKQKPLIPFYVKIYMSQDEEIYCEYFDDVLMELELATTLKNGLFPLFNSDVSRKIFLKAKIVSISEVFERHSFFSKILNFKDSLVENVDCCVEKPYNFFVNGFLFGNSSEIPYKFKRIINRCGLSHVFAISGLHITILSIFIILILRLLRCPGFFSFVVLFCCLFFYAFIVGFSPSVLRACFMAFFVSIGMFFDAKIKIFESLCFAAATILLIWPMSVLGLSFLLSFSSVLGIAVFKNKISNFILAKFGIDNRILIFLVENFSTSISAIFSTSIFLIFCFKKVSIVAPIANLIVVGVLPVLYVACVFVAIFGMFSKNVAMFFGGFCEIVFGVIFKILELISNFNFCYISANSLLFKIIVLTLTIFTIVCFLFFKRFIFSKNFFIVSGLIVAFPTVFSLSFFGNITRVYFLKNMFGTNVVVLSKRKVVVINCGGKLRAGRDVVEFLDSKGFSRIDILILASSSKRHCLGVYDLLQAMPPKYLVLSKNARKIDVLEGVDFVKTNVILNDNFFLEIAPIGVNVFNNGVNFGCLFHFDDFCFSYSKNLDFILKMSKKRNVDFVFLDEKVNDVKDVSFLQFKVKKCFGLLNEDLFCDFFESLEKNKKTEFKFYKNRYEKGEENIYELIRNKIRRKN